MKRISLITLAALMLVSVAGTAIATTTPDTAVIKTRIFNDCPSSTIVTTNNYPTAIVIDDSVLDCFGFANLHNWRFSQDGVNPILFRNRDSFTFSADLVIDGTAEGEAGLQIAPWWSPDVDGRLNVRTTDGEIACFGGRLPFYSFTASQSVTYTKGTSIHLEIDYQPNGLSRISPATIEYKLTYNTVPYTSGPLPFDQGNPSEPYGVWGMLDDARVGGHVQAFLQGGNPNAQLVATWSDIVFNVKADGKFVPGVSPWAASLLALLLLGSATIMVLRRRADVA